jgi:hypothetical protein
MSLSTVVRSINVGGLAVDVFSTDWQRKSANDPSESLNIVSALPITVLILLHGRERDKTAMRPLAENSLKYARDKTLQTVYGSERTASHELMVVTLVWFELNSALASAEECQYASY